MVVKQSLELLGVNSSGLQNITSAQPPSKNDDEIVGYVKSLSNLSEKENYLRNLLEKKPAGYLKSKHLLVELIKKSDPKYACDLTISICQSSPIDPNNYLLFAQIAVDHNAWKVALSALDVVKWLSLDNHKDILENRNQLLKLIDEKINNNVQDNSKNEFWHNKAPDKYWILERLYFQAKFKKLVEYSFKLLEVFPGSLDNYEIVLKAISQTNDKEAFYKLVEYIKTNLNDPLYLNLYLGMTYYQLSEFTLATNHLKAVLEQDKMNQKALFCLSLINLMTNNLKDFAVNSLKVFSAPDPSFIALYFISSAVSDLNIDSAEFPSQKNISREISIIIDRLLKEGKKETAFFLVNQFKKLNYHITLPYLPLFISEVFIRHKELEYAKELLKISNDFEVHRLYAWIYRLLGKDDLAEKELIEYRKNWIPNKDIGLYCQLVNLNLPQEVPETIEEIFDSVKAAYDETKKLIQEFDLEYGLNAMTCVETGCQDCCKKTFPYISYTEYLYMKKWLDTQDETFKRNIYDQSVKIVNLYKEKYKKDPPFMCGEHIDQQKEYPSDFVFECPYLGDNKCNVYQARPFTCRAYSYASQDGIKYKGCNYFFEQIKGATKLNDIRKVINMPSFFEFAKLIDEKLIGRRVIAPIPVWFAQSHEETVEKVKRVISEKKA